MNIFEKTKQDEIEMKKFESQLADLLVQLQPYADNINIASLERIRDDFQKKVMDFYREDRKLNIGVIGQVKAGKSTFLNTLLFGGEKILPSAATPKTAALTKIEYGETNQIRVEYFTEDEWKLIEKNAGVDSPDTEFKVAKEIMKLAQQKNIDPYQCIRKGHEVFELDSSQKLMDKLNDYVGENGTYTALVKNVVMYVNREELKGISVVDTPGMNDPIVSRTDRTRQFINLCDVVFFLSTTSKFLSQEDMKLLTAQLPQKGVKKIVMIGSQFDRGLSGEIEDYDSMEEALDEVKYSLTNHAVRTMDKFIHNRDCGPEIEACKRPIFISSICWDMSHKEMSEYTDFENNVLNLLNEYDDVDQAMLRQIGNVDTVQREFEKVVSEKDETLSRKAREFVPTVQRELQVTLQELSNGVENNIEILRTGDVKSLDDQRRAMQSQINSIRGDIENVFGELLNKLERAKIDTMGKLREAQRDYSKLVEKQGTEVHTSSHYVSDSKWYNPFSWGKGHTEYSSYETHYTYVDASDALESIRNFSVDASTDIEKAFSETVDVVGTKRSLLRVVTENFEVSDESFDPAMFKRVTAETLNEVVFPVMQMDVSEEQQEIAADFAGEIRDSGQRFQLQLKLSKVLGKLLDIFSKQFLSEVEGFRGEILKLKDSFEEKLLTNIEADFAHLKKQFEDKENEIKRMEQLLGVLHDVSK